MTRAKRLVPMLLAAAAMTVVAGCGSDDNSGSSGSGSSSAATATATPEVKGKVGVILPDTASSARWENNDRPLLKAAFDAAGVDSDIQNAQGDKAKFATIADQMLSGGVNVMLITNLDSPSAARTTTCPSTTWRWAPRSAKAWSSAWAITASRAARWPCSTARRPTTTP